MSQDLHLKLVVGDHGMRSPTLRAADLMEVFAQDLRDQAAGGLLVTAPGYKLSLNGDVLEVLNELP